MTDGSGSTEYCHDRQGQLVRKVQVTNGLTFVTQYTHTLAGRLASMTYPGGARVEYARNALGQPTGATVTTATGTQSLLANVVWYPFGPPAELAYGDGRRLQRSLNRNYQPGFIEDTASGGLSLGYGFDAVGNLQVLRKGDQSEPPLRTYGYDALNRLTGVSDGATGAQLQEYAYDATGNRTGSTAGGIVSVYAYPPDSHRLAQVDAVPRAYDSNGNTTAIGPRTFVYTPANRMGQVLRDGVVVGEYRYNGRGEQVWRQAQVGVDCTGADRNRDACQGQKPGAPADGTSSCEGLRGRERRECERGRHQPDNPGPPGGVTVQTTTFVYGESGHLLGQYDETGAALQEVIWLDDLPVGLIAGNGIESKLFHIQADLLGTPRVVIDPVRQQSVWTWPLTGEAFGKEAPKEDPDGDGAEFVFDLRFPGQRFDAASELNYNYFRDYEPGTGRYVESDPVGQLAGVSTYSYVSGSPFIWADLYGLLQWTTHPVQWSPTLAPGLQTRTYPGDRLSTVTAASLARTTLNWNISAECSCGAGGFSLDEFSVAFTPIVFMRQRYDNLRERAATRREEMDHVRDLTAWVGGARSDAQDLENSMKGHIFETAMECAEAARQAMQDLLQPGAREAVISSHNRWDASGRHVQQYGGP